MKSITRNYMIKKIELKYSNTYDLKIMPLNRIAYIYNKLIEQN